MNKNISILALTLFFSASIYAQNWYFDGGFSLIKFTDAADESISPSNIYMRGGYQINQYFNVGLESSATISPDQIPSLPDVDLDVDAVTGYLRGGVPVNDSIWLYGQIGRTRTSLTAEGQGNEVSEDDSDTMFGFGAEIDLGSKSTYLALNYSIYNNNDGVDVNAFNLGIGLRF
jgi:hypothetical protein